MARVQCRARLQTGCCFEGVRVRAAHTPWSQAKHAESKTTMAPPRATLLMFRRLAGRRTGCVGIPSYEYMIYTARAAIVLEQMPAVLAAH